jgi:hypothetical protein
MSGGQREEAEAMRAVRAKKAGWTAGKETFIS